MNAKRISRIVILSFWMMLLLLFLARGAKAETIITIPAEIEVESSVLLLGNIANIMTDNAAYAQSLGYLRIGKAPLLGQTKRFRRSFFTTRLKQLRINPAEITLNIPPIVSVHRRSAKVDIHKLAQAAKRAILQRMAYEGQEVHISLNNIVGELKVPAGHVTYVATVPKKKRMIGRQVIPVEVLVDGLPFKRVNVSLKIEVYSSVWVTAVSLTRHHLIEKGDLEQKRVRLNDFIGKDLLRDLDLIIGQRTRVPIAKGRPISSYKIEEPPLVERGDLVTIKAFHENISLLTPGQALENGGFGEVILIKSLNSKKKVMGRVVTNELVEVEVR